MMESLKLAIIIVVLGTSCKTTKVGAECKEPAKSDCVCTMQYDPVCGCDGKTYGNACVASCSGVKSFNKGKCPNDE